MKFHLKIYSGYHTETKLSSRKAQIVQWFSRHVRKGMLSKHGHKRPLFVGKKIQNVHDITVVVTLAVNTYARVDCRSSLSALLLLLTVFQAFTFLITDSCLALM